MGPGEVNFTPSGEDVTIKGIPAAARKRPVAGNLLNFPRSPSRASKQIREPSPTAPDRV